MGLADGGLDFTESHGGVKQGSDRNDVIYIFEKVTACGRRTWADQAWKQGHASGDLYQEPGGGRSLAQGQP